MFDVGRDMVSLRCLKEHWISERLNSEFEPSNYLNRFRSSGFPRAAVSRSCPNIAGYRDKSAEVHNVRPLAALLPCMY